MRTSLALIKTLHSCLKTIAILGAPIAPFFMDRLYRDVNEGIGVNRDGAENSVHLALFPEPNSNKIDSDA